MIRFLISWFVTAVAVFAAAYFVPGVSYGHNYGTLAIAAFVLGLLNAFIKPVLMLLTLPLNILTLGLLTLFINALLFSLAGYLVPDFRVDGFWAAFFGALIVSVVSFVMNSLMPRRKPATPAQTKDKVIDV
jgi:putative membrane protein